MMHMTRVDQNRSTLDDDYSFMFPIYAYYALFSEADHETAYYVF